MKRGGGYIIIRGKMKREMKRIMRYIEIVRGENKRIGGEIQH